MLQFLPIEERNLFAVRATGKLTSDDYQQFLPELETRIGDQEQVSILMELDDFHGWTLEAAKDDFRIGSKFGDRIERIALVGDKLWQRWMAAMSKPFINGQIRYFSRDEVGDAWDWLRESLLKPEPADTSLVPYKRLIAAMDFSAHSVHATKRALELSKLYNAQLTLLHVINEEYLYDILYGPGDIGFAGYESLYDSQVSEKALRESAETKIKQLFAQLGVEQLECEIVVGTPANAIISFAESQQAELIVMGTHGRKGLARLLGSNASSVVTRARCEVLTIPLQNKEPAE